MSNVRWATSRSLTILTERSNLSTRLGLSETLRETVLTLLRSPQYWSHARVRSQTLNSREAAAARFEQLSIEERSKFRTETLVNVGGSLQRQTPARSRLSDSGAYMIVTLLIATTHDRPMVNQVHSTDELREVLQRLGAIAPYDLLVYELIWTSQDARDTLSYDEMIAQYPSLIQL
ncbi:DUF1517 domain-containing protein [Leptolyngbya sp. AN02str]|uniref:DUF1517 domain-containing protein n=1 Tax=Leptolyngbya sp. AN02str TaxID=3423363 RepID=UPI003D317C28